MPYLTPSKESLQEFILSLRVKYDKQPRKTREGVAAIEKLELLSQKIDDPNFCDIMIGAILMYSEDRLYGTLGDVLSLGPHNYPNFIPEKQKLVCLDTFLTYANTQNLPLNSTESKEDLAGRNTLALKPVIDNITSRFDQDINDLYRKARIITVEGQIAKLPNEYKKEKEAHPPSYLSTFRAFDYSKERQKYLQLTAILNTPSLNHLLPATCTTPLSQEHYKYIIRCGFLLYMMKLISSQWGGANSKLLELCADIFGTKNINEIPKTEQQIYISNFREFIIRAQSHPEIIKTLKETGLGKEDKKIASFLAGVVKNIDSNFEGIVKPIVKGALFASVASLTQFVIGIHIAKLANAVWTAGYGKGLLPALMAEAGHMIGGPAGRTIATYAGTVYEEAVMPAIYARSFGLGLGYTTGKLFGSDAKAHSKEMRATQEYCVRLDKDINHVTKEEELWRVALQQEIAWITAISKYRPDALAKLQIILSAYSIMTVVSGDKELAESKTEATFRKT